MVHFFKFQYPTVILVVVLINFGVKKQIPKISFNISVGDFMSVFFYEFVDILEIIPDFRSDPFTLIDLYLPTNSYMIACTNI